MTRRSLLSAAAAAPLAATRSFAQLGRDDLQFENVVESEGSFTLAPGPKVEGVIFLGAYDTQKVWPEKVGEAFHAVPWIDAASVRVRWTSLEPRPDEFNWGYFDRTLAEVKKFNATHSAATRILQIRPVAGEHCPAWFEQEGVRFYETSQPAPDNPKKPLRAPLPFDNPVYLDRLRRMYRAIYDRYRDEPLVALYHGTCSAGPWDEIFIPIGSAPLPPDYTPEKFATGMCRQLDVLLEEFSLKGKPAELPWSGVYNPGAPFLTMLKDRIVERLGKRSPYLCSRMDGRLSW